MAFEQLLHAQKLDKKLTDAIERLLERKRAGQELAIENRITVINDFLEEKIAYFEAYAKTQRIKKSKQIEILNELFRDAVKTSLVTI